MRTDGFEYGSPGNRGYFQKPLDKTQAGVVSYAAQGTTKGTIVPEDQDQATPVDATEDEAQPEAFEGEFAIEDFLSGLQNFVPPEAADPIVVQRFWLDNESFRALAVLSANDNVAILVSDGENTIALFDSLTSSLEDLYVIEGAVAAAIAILDPPPVVAALVVDDLQEIA